MKTFSIYLITLLCIVSLSACAGKSRAAKKQAEAERATTVDITRPPEMQIEKALPKTPSNPEEPVSMDKWNKNQGPDQTSDE